MSTRARGPDRLEALLASIAHESYARVALKLAERCDGNLTAMEARVYDDALLRLARAETSNVRVQISRRLAPVEAGPERSVTDLAYDLDPDVAAPMLQKSVLLKEADLITIARTRGQGHLSALAERLAVSAPVTDVVATRGSWPVLRLLAANRTAELSGNSLARLVALSRGDGHITVALTKRGDVPAAAKKSLLAQFRTMAVSGRTSLCGEHSDVPLGTEISAGQPSDGPGCRDPLSAEMLRCAEVRVSAVAQSRGLTSAEVCPALGQGRLAEAVIIIARLADEEPEAFVQALRGRGPFENFALLVMRSADLSGATAERVLRETRAASIARQREAYDGLSCAAARRALQAVRLRAGFTITAGEVQSAEHAANRAPHGVRTTASSSCNASEGWSIGSLLGRDADSTRAISDLKCK